MAIDMQKAGVTELYVRMHCNGCAHKIKKAIRTIDGVHDINIDIHQQKITVIGGADPELLVKAIKKKKKTASISSHTEPAGNSTEPAAPASQPPTESPPAEATPPPTEPPKDVPTTEPPKDPPPPPAETPEAAKPPHQEPNEEVNMMHHHYHPHNYAYGGHWNSFGHDTRNLAPYQDMHSYNTHRPSPYVTEYVSDYGPASTTPPRDARYDHGYGDGYYQNRGGDSNQMTSMFSEENPNSCTIV